MNNTVLSKTLLLLFLLQSVNSWSQLKFSLNPEIGYVYGGKNRSDAFTTVTRHDRINKNISNKSGLLVV